MNKPLNPITKEYLMTFHRILDEMIHGMENAEKKNSISYNFIVQMIPHHQAAIEMSKNILRYTSNPPLQKIASGIIEEQTKSIANMQRIKEHCLHKPNSPQELCAYQNNMDQIMEVMFFEMKTAPACSRVNCDFMWEMIPHHLGAVRMSKTTLQNSICPELKPILNAIISSQERGIMQMQQLLLRLGCRRC